MKSRKWTNKQLIASVSKSQSFRQVIIALGLVPAGGNYAHVVREVHRLKLNITHFKGKGWSKGKIIPREPIIPMSHILVSNSGFQSFKLKKRLFAAGLKKPRCEICGWAAISPDGRIPLELDHINGNHRDNRIENLRILCPNCHSLQPTHRGRNIGGRGGVIGSRV